MNKLQFQEYDITYWHFLEVVYKSFIPNNELHLWQLISPLSIGIMDKFAIQEDDVTHLTLSVWYEMMQIISNN